MSCLNLEGVYSLSNSGSGSLLSLTLPGCLNLMWIEYRSPCLKVSVFFVYSLPRESAHQTVVQQRSISRCPGNVLSEALPSRCSYSGFQASCNNVLGRENAPSHTSSVKRCLLVCVSVLQTDDFRKIIWSYKYLQKWISLIKCQIQAWNITPNFCRLQLYCSLSKITGGTDVIHKILNYMKFTFHFSFNVTVRAQAWYPKSQEINVYFFFLEFFRIRRIYWAYSLVWPW
jgi:hypothetical protein